VAGSVHAVKSAVVRPIVTATTGGAGNVPVSIAEDIFATVMSILAILVPILVAVILILMVTLFLRWRQRRREKADMNI
jgi:predicted membrane protein